MRTYYVSAYLDNTLFVCPTFYILIWVTTLYSRYDIDIPFQASMHIFGKPRGYWTTHLA